MGIDSGRHLRGEESARVVLRRRRRDWNEAEAEETARGVSLALNRPADARAGDIVALQRLAGNQAVVQLAAPAAGPTAAAAAPTPLPPGPYTGRRMRNDKMDAFEDQQYLFGPEIFRHYGPYWELWAPLAGLIGKYFVMNMTTEEGIGLETADRRVAAWVIIERFNSTKAAAIRQEKAGRARNTALLDAIWAEFGRQYSSPTTAATGSGYGATSASTTSGWRSVSAMCSHRTPTSRSGGSLRRPGQRQRTSRVSRGASAGKPGSA